MKKNLKKINYGEMVRNNIREDHRIDNDIFLLDEYLVDPVNEYEFLAKGNTFIEVIDGVGTIIIDDKEYNVDGHCLIGYLAGQKIITSIRSTSLQRGVSFSPSFLEEMNQGSARFNEFKFSIIHNPVVEINEFNGKAFELYAKVMRLIASMPSSMDRTLCAKHVTLSLFYGPLHDAFKKTLENENSRGKILSSKFFDLLDRNYKKEHELAFYAESLGISRQHLHNCVLSSSEQAPGYWIDQYLLREAKRMLRDTSLQINTITDMLNFNGSKQFGRFFKNQTGLTPSEYRKQL